MPSQKSEQGVGVTAMGGVTLPACGGQHEACTDPPSAAPSLRALVLYRPEPRFGIGAVGWLTGFHWQASYPSMISATDPPGHVEADIRVGFLGLSGRYLALPGALVSPVAEVAVGGVFQSQTGSNFNCSAGAFPAVEGGLGASARLVDELRILAVASGHFGLSDFCGASDGPPATPFFGTGYAVHAGLSYDFAIGGG